MSSPALTAPSRLEFLRHRSAKNPEGPGFTFLDAEGAEAEARLASGEGGAEQDGSP